MTLLTLGEAARRTGIGARTLKRAVEDGRLPARRQDGWVYQINSDDLAGFSLVHRVEQLTSSTRQRQYVAARPRAAALPVKPPSGLLNWLKMVIEGLRPARELPARGAASRGSVPE